MFGSILLKDQGVENKLNDIDKKAAGTSKSMGLSFGSIAGAAIKLGGILGAGLGIKSIIQEGAKGDEILAQLDSVLKSTGESAGITKSSVLKLSENLGHLTKFSVDSVTSAQSLLLTFTNIGKDVFPNATETVLDMSQALGQDLKSSSVQLGKALNDPIAGITALSRVGVTFTDQQKEQIKTLVESGKTVEAQKVILAELNKEFGNSAKAAGETFGGQLTILKNKITDVGEGIGQKLNPYMIKFVTYISDNVPKIQQTIGNLVDLVVPKFQEWGKLIGQIATELLPSFGDSTKDAQIKVGDLAKNGLNFVTDALTWIRDNAEIIKVGVASLTAVWLIQKGVILAHNIALVAHSVAQGVKMVQDKLETGYIIALYIAQGIHTGIMKAATISQTALNVATGAFGVILAIITSPIGLVVLAIGALIGIGVLLYKNWDTIKEKAMPIFKSIGDFVGGVVDGIKNGFKGMVNGVISGLNFMIRALNRLHFTVPDWIPVIGGKGFGFDLKELPQLAKGTEYWQGGTAMINEVGGEIVDLPRGSRVIPHDVSMEMAKNSEKTTQTDNRPIELVINLNYKTLARELYNYNDLVARGAGVR